MRKIPKGPASRILDEIIEDLGALWRKIQDPKWVAAEGQKAAVSIYVIGPAGRKVKAELTHFLFDSDRQTGIRGFKDSAGNEYIEKDGNKYYWNPNTKAFEEA